MPPKKKRARSPKKRDASPPKPKRKRQRSKSPPKKAMAAAAAAPKSEEKKSEEKKSNPICCVCLDEPVEKLTECKHPVCQTCLKSLLVNDPRCPQCRKPLEIPTEMKRRTEISQKCKKEAEVQASSVVALISTQPGAGADDAYNFYTKIYPWIEKACADVANIQHFDRTMNKLNIYQDSILRSRSTNELRPALEAKKFAEIRKQLGSEIPGELKASFMETVRKDATINKRIQDIDREDRRKVSELVQSQSMYGLLNDPLFLDKIFLDSLFLVLWYRSRQPI
jgi:hypothetical protein